MGAHLVFLDESGFLLIPTVVRTWGPQGHTPILRHWLKRDRLSTFTALTVSPKRRRLGLYFRGYDRNLTGVEVRAFLRALLRHLRGAVVLLWDAGSIHQRRLVQAYLAAHPRVRPESFPTYAPELNPAEHVGTHLDRALANGAPDDLGDLRGRLHTALRRLRHSQALLWACIEASELPWKR